MFMSDVGRAWTTPNDWLAVIGVGKTKRPNPLTYESAMKVDSASSDSPVQVDNPSLVSKIVSGENEVDGWGDDWE